MKFETAAIDEGQVRDPKRDPATGPGSGHRPAPLAARLEVTPWLASEFEVAVTLLPKESKLRLLTPALSSFEEEREHEQTDPAIHFFND